MVYVYEKDNGRVHDGINALIGNVHGVVSGTGKTHTHTQTQRVRDRMSVTFNSGARTINSRRGQNKADKIEAWNGPYRKQAPSPSFQRPLWSDEGAIVTATDPSGRTDNGGIASACS